MGIDTRFEPYIHWLDHEKKNMVSLLKSWAEIPTYTHDLEGLTNLSQYVKSEFGKLADETEVIDLPKAFKTNSDGKTEPFKINPALSFKKRTKAAKKIFLGGHIDTVHKTHFKIQETPNKLIGPGVADMKGGLVILLKALEAFERSPFAKGLGWEVFINSDEEIGSPSSGNVLKERARLYHSSLWYEPALNEGYLAGRRKGSLNATLFFRGKGGHAGRDFDTAKNALTSSIRFIQSLEERKHPQVDINYGELTSGYAHNVIPALACLKINARSFEPYSLDSLLPLMHSIAKIEKDKYGIDVEIVDKGYRPPKEFPEPLFKQMKSSANRLGIKLDTKETGGVSDGNLISSVHVPCLDTMGAVGGGIHTSDEWIDIDSLAERAKLSLLYFLEEGSRS